MTKKPQIKKATQEELAKYLGITVAGVKKIRKDKRLIMVLGLSVLNNIGKDREWT